MVLSPSVCKRSEKKLRDNAKSLKQVRRVRQVRGTDFVIKFSLDANVQVGMGARQEVGLSLISIVRRKTSVEQLLVCFHFKSSDF